MDVDMSMSRIVEPVRQRSTGGSFASATTFDAFDPYIGQRRFLREVFPDWHTTDMAASEASAVVKMNERLLMAALALVSEFEV